MRQRGTEGKGDRTEHEMGILTGSICKETSAVDDVRIVSELLPVLLIGEVLPSFWNWDGIQLEDEGIVWKEQSQRIGVIIRSIPRLYSGLDGNDSPSIISVFGSENL